MKFKFLLTSAAIVFAAFSASAETFYVSPEGAGEKTGADAANAMGIAEFTAKVNAAGYVGGDNFNFAGGNYEFTTTVKVPSGKCISLLAEDDAPATFDAKGNECIIYYNGAANAVSIKNINFTGVVTKIDRTSENEKKIFGALLLHNCSKTTIENCSFYGNKAEGTLGGVALNLYGSSSVTLKNCKIENNDVVARAAVYMHSDAPSRGTTVFENCLFKGNKSTDLGAAMFVQHAVQVVVNGCTFTENVCTGSNPRGSVLYANGSANLTDKNSYPDKIYFINSTLAENPNDGGAQIFMADNGHLWMINNIIVSKSEARAAATPAIKFTSASKANLVSGGYNYIGSTTNVAATVWQETDQTDKDYASIFGTHSLNGAGFIKPAVYVKGANGTEIAEATKDWGLPKGVNVENRENDVTPGAHGYNEETVTTGIADIAADANDVKIIALGGGNYQLLGYEGAVQVYSISGAQVLATVAPEVNLSSLAAGVYLVRAGKKVVKVVR